MQKKSGQVALGGIATGMCIALMFATGMIPLPCGRKTGFPRH